MVLNISICNNRNMKWAVILAFLLLFFSCGKETKPDRDNDLETYSQVLDNIDESKFNTYYNDIQRGILVYETNPGNDYDNVVDRLFINSLSEEEVYYTGENRGYGTFWIKNNDKKIIILEIYIVYGPMVKWHGEKIVEIVRPSGSPFRESYFYDFETDKISKEYEFPIYFDRANKVILIWGEHDFELYDLNNDELIREYNFRQENQMTAAWPYIDYYVEKIGNQIIALFYNDWYNKRKGKIILDISK